MSVLSTELEVRMQKVAWSGAIVAVQPRIRLVCSCDERYHGYHGYVLRIEGTCGGESDQAGIAVGRGSTRGAGRVVLHRRGLGRRIVHGAPRSR